MKTTRRNKSSLPKFIFILLLATIFLLQACDSISPVSSTERPVRIAPSVDINSDDEGSPPEETSDIPAEDSAEPSSDPSEEPTAESSKEPISTSETQSEIIIVNEINDFPQDILFQTVPIGTEIKDLNLPSTLTGEDEDAQPLDIADTVWENSTFNPEEAGEYLFTAMLPEGYEWAEGMQAPVITVQLLSTTEFDISDGSVVIATSGSGTLSITQAGTLVTDAHPLEETITVMGTSNTNQIQINTTEGNPVVVLSDVSIDASATSGLAPVKLNGTTTATIMLSGNNTLLAGTNAAAIQINATASLTLDGSGSLQATGGNNGAGIGGYGKSGFVQIVSGTITAQGGQNAAGIGSGSGGADAVVHILGGTVTAQGGANAAGIGSGNNASVKEIIISHAGVTATGGDYGAGVGSGNGGRVGTININNIGTFQATGGICGAGIGGGRRGAVDAISIDQATLTATGMPLPQDGTSSSSYNGMGGAGIGGGGADSYWNSGLVTKNITITQSNITANGSFGAAGVGGGAYGRSDAITITASTVFAKTQNGGAGIGGGYNNERAADNGGKGGDITITGSTITAETEYGSGIGDGNGYYAKEHQGKSHIVITGSTVDAKVTGGTGAGIGGTNPIIEIRNNPSIKAVSGASKSGAGIGGAGTRNANITIVDNDYVEATGYEGAGIGGGMFGAANDIITLRGGTVKATSYYGAGIGGGGQTNSYGSTHYAGGQGGTINIEAGDITATSTQGAGIGGGNGGGLADYTNNNQYANGGNINITGGNITAKSQNGAGIGGGGARNSYSSSGTHNGSGGSGGTIRISNATVNASSTGGTISGSAGIGNGGGTTTGGRYTPFDILIDNSTITAKGGAYGAGIGSGQRGGNGKIELRNSKVEAYGGTSGAPGIGGGKDGYSIPVTIIGDSSDIYAKSGGTSVAVGTNGSYVTHPAIIDGAAKIYFESTGGSRYLTSPLVVQGNGTTDITLRNYQVQTSYMNGFATQDGINVNLKIEGDVVFNTNRQNSSGMLVPTGTSLQIADNTFNGLCTLTATATSGNAYGIGADNAGEIIIQGCLINATGISSGIGGNGADILFSGGTTVTRGNFDISGNSIVIKGGSVDARKVEGVPTNGTDNVYLNVLQFENLNMVKRVSGGSIAGFAMVDDVSQAAGIPYGIYYVYTDNSGTVYYWFPVSEERVPVEGYITGDDVPYENYYARPEETVEKLLGRPNAVTIYPQNNSTPSQEDYIVQYGHPLYPKLPDGTLTPPINIGHKFLGWFDSSSGGTMYENIDTYFDSITNVMELYAQWEVDPNRYTITYDANGGTGTFQDSNTYLNSEQAKILKNEGQIIWPGHGFLGWNTEADGTGTEYPAYVDNPIDGTIIVTENITLYAQWRADLYSVFYNANGGTGTQSDHTAYEYGDTVIVKDAGTIAKDGYRFLGWSTQANGTLQYSPNSNFVMGENDVTLYAIWSAEPTPSPTSTSSASAMPTASVTATPTNGSDDEQEESTENPSESPIVGNTDSDDDTDIGVPPDNGGTTTDVDNTDGADNTIPPGGVALVNGWSLLSLLVGLVGAAGAIILLIRILLKKRTQESTASEQESTTQEEDSPKYARLKKFLRIGAIVAGALSMILFLLLEDFSQPMVWINRYTILIVMIVVIQALLVLIKFLFKKKENSLNNE